MQFTTYWPLICLLTLPVLLAGLWWTLVDRPRAKMLASFALRCLAVLLLIAALCRPYMSQDSQRVHVTFLLDVSASVDLLGAERAVDEVASAIDQLEAGDSWSLALVGRDVRLVDDLESLRQTLTSWREGGSDDTFRRGSELGEALRAVRLTFPAGKARRVVLFSDGRPTGTPVADALRVLQREQVDVRFASIPGLREPEAAVTALTASTPRAFKDQVVRLTVEAAANTAMLAELRLVNRGVIVQRRPVQLDPAAPSRVSFDVPMTTVGATVWRAELAPAQDHFPINNAMSCTIDVVGEPRVLVLHEEPTLMREIARALRTQGFDLDVRPPVGLPHQIDELLAFDAIVLANIPATSMQPRQMTLLKQYVSDFGGGLMMMGSENSFGLGGYYRTPVEEVLPLVSRFEKEKEKPSLAMALVIDKSGSMDGLPIALARQAAKAAVEMLSPQDQVGVVGFDSQAFVVADMQPAATRDSINAAIDRIGAGGGTFMFAGMDAARQMLERTAARIKHMIVLGDGVSQPADHEGLAARLADMGVTVSTVALGPGADRPLMQRIAEIGRGRYYETLDPANVPQIFTRETMQASRSAIKEDLYACVQVTDHPMLIGFEGTPLPFSLGFVMTRPKPTARVLLATETGDPLLAFSRFGLGATVAFTSDLTPQWGAEWLAWPHVGKFWSQVLRAIVRHRDPDGLHVQVHAQPDALQFDIHATGPDGAPAANLNLDGQLLADQQPPRTVPIHQVGLGRYRARVTTADAQRLTFRVHDQDRDKLRVLHHHRPYHAEYLLTSRPDDQLTALPAFNATTVRTDIASVPQRQRIDFAFVFAALGAMLTGLLLRRL